MRDSIVRDACFDASIVDKFGLNRVPTLIDCGRIVTVVRFD